MSDGSTAGRLPRLDPSAARIREMGDQVLSLVADYYDSVRRRDVYPQTSSQEIERLLAQPLPEEGRPLEELLSLFRDVVVEKSRHNGHPRFFGYVNSPGTAIAALADLLTSALNANVTAWRSAPAAAQVEWLAVDWIRQALGLPEGAGGLFTSGGSMANFTALTAARYLHGGERVDEQGVAALDRPLRVYVSTEGHHSIDKAAVLLGLGRANVRRVAVDDRLRMDVADLERQIVADRAAGAQPFCVVASAGTVVTGAVDPLREVIGIAHEHDLWAHVDAAYGGFARLAPSVRERLDGIEDADSVTLDPHKWLYLPASCGCLIYRDPAAVTPAFSLGADYTRVLEQQPAEAFAFWDYGPELTRRFRALTVWLTMAYVGTAEMARAIEANLDCAHYLAERIDASPDLERLAPTELSICCFRYAPSGTTRSDGELNALNERILLASQRAGGSYLSNATVDGRFGLRACVLNYRTSRGDIDRMLEDVLAAARKVVGRG